MGALFGIRQVREYLSHTENRYLVLAVAAMIAMMAFLYSVRITVARDAGSGKRQIPPFANGTNH